MSNTDAPKSLKASWKIGRLAAYFNVILGAYIAIRGLQTGYPTAAAGGVAWASVSAALAYFTRGVGEK